MIPIPITTALLLYLGITVIGILGGWLLHHWKNRSKRLSLAEEKLTQCEFCAFPFLAPRGKTICRCPQCQSFTKL